MDDHADKPIRTKKLDGTLGRSSLLNERMREN
jgi:hypothetical protein